MALDPAVLERLRAICLALPETTEAGGVGDPTFRVRDKIFAMQHSVDHTADPRPSFWCKARLETQDFLVRARPDRYFVPPYVGQHGWVGILLDAETDWAELEDLAISGYRLTAPKRLLAQLDT